MILEQIKELVAEGWSVNAVWLVPATSQISRSHDGWEAHVKIADFVPQGEGGVTDIELTIDSAKIPDGVHVTAREKVSDQIFPLPPMSDEQAEAIAAEIHRAGDATATQRTASGCIAIGPCAAWCKDPLRAAILNSRKP
jgi:hypothetical protein